ncbi:MAG TPA: diadenylate cyclase, partial [Clostridia bacterium]|nr:diadenylate cyclase [Clostridia bacterium]
MPYDELVKAITSGLSQFRWIADSVDIIIIAVLLYRLIVLTKETRAYQVLKGIGVLFLAAILSDALQLQTVSWMLNSIVASGIIVMVVLFQPELRRAFEHIGRGELFTKNLFNEVHLEEAQIVAELQQAILNLSKRRVGALIVIELKTGLADIVSTGTRIEGVISAPLIENIFEPNTPLHDGAVIICDG